MIIAIVTLLKSDSDFEKNSMEEISSFPSIISVKPLSGVTSLQKNTKLFCKIQDNSFDDFTEFLFTNLPQGSYQIRKGAKL